MADTVVMDSPEANSSAKKKKSLKRKRTSPSVAVKESLSTEEREARIGELRVELDGLFKYYKEVLEQKKMCSERIGECRSPNSVIACLLEESSLPLSKLVDQIYEKVKSGGGSFSTVASVKSSVLLIGQRSFYGVPNPDADLLEDDDDSCLWCWETRDLKLLPKSVRGALKIWRTCRKKIHERICAVSVMIKTLQKLESHQNCKQELMKAFERLGKVLREADIRLLVESMVQKNGADMAEKEVKRENKLLVKELERNQRDAEKEKKRMDLELQKEKFQTEKEEKRLQEEAEKKERQREKEESELRKQLRKQQEEAEKDQKRREKEEAALKKQLALQKQASLMERFLKRSKNSNSPSQNDQSSPKATSPDLSSHNTKEWSISLSMDSALSQKDGIKIEDMWKSHLISWHNLGRSIRSNRKQHWGIRKKPKTELVKELKLTTTSKEMPRDDELNLEKLDDGWDDGRSCHTKLDGALPSGSKCNHKQLLQFDKSNRPAFYGIWSKKSIVVGPRRPLVKDPDLDYEIDSDEEWEEEEPGESLSDCDKDEEESLEEGCLKADDDEDESEDSFFVPDGYLSENEGVQVDRMECDDIVVVEGSSGCKQDVVESEELLAFFRRRKYLHNLTEHALRKNRPLIVLNFTQDKVAPPLLSSDKKGLNELENTCLHALSMRAFPGSPSIVEISVGNDLQEEASPSNSTSTTPTAVLDSDLPQIVSIIQSCSQGINKVVESLHNQFPAIPKSHLRNKVREISDFVDNHWQVKKDLLNKLGLPTTPDKVSWTKKKSIATFFSKRCLPPSANMKTGNHPNETSPRSSQKPSASSAVGATAALQD